MKSTASLMLAGIVLASVSAASAGNDFMYDDSYRSFPILKNSNFQPNLGNGVQFHTIKRRVPVRPIADDHVPMAPAADGEMPVYVDDAMPVYEEPIPAQSMPLYPHVRYSDRHNIHPCAVTKVVSVRKPCGPCGQGGCVYVQICVPPCGCPKVEVSDDGYEVEYDYGKYEVELEWKDGCLEVDYDDGLF